jgi:uncharacterized protein DUF4352
MKRLALFTLCLLLLVPALAQRRQNQAVNVELQLVDQKRTATGSQTHDLVELKVRLTNKGDSPLVYTNNRFMLTDSEQKTYTVNRLRYPERSTLEPGGSVVVERIFFDVPKKSEPSKLSFLTGRKPAKTIDL